MRELFASERQPNDNYSFYYFKFRETDFHGDFGIDFETRVIPYRSGCAPTFREKRSIKRTRPGIHWLFVARRHYQIVIGRRPADPFTNVGRGRANGTQCVQPSRRDGPSGSPAAPAQHGQWRRDADSIVITP